MVDHLGRKINYLRLSVTDLCNLRCVYCMPKQGIPKMEHKNILSIEEIEQIVRSAVMCGIDKVRITGGEPLVRNGILEICRKISQIPEIREVCLTTNGVLLEEMAEALYQSGVNRLNISLDTLNPEKFSSITRVGNLDTILRGIKKAKSVGFQKTKINVVLIGGFNEDEIRDFVELTKFEDTQVRFIELMPIGQCSHWSPDRFLSSEAVLQAVPELQPVGNEGVANLYQIPGYLGEIGLISPMSHHFCPSCNRIRITSDGKLKACLHSAREVDLKAVPAAELPMAIASAIVEKPQSHHLSSSTPSESLRSMYQIGG